MNWLTDLTNWLAQLVKDTFAALVKFANDLLVIGVELYTDFFRMMLDLIPIPAALQNSSLGAIFSMLPPEAQWMLVMCKVPEGLAFLAAGIAFNLTRKLLTLGQW